MKPFYYKETQDLTNTNGIQKAFETGVASEWLMLTFAICMIGLIIMLITLLIKTKGISKKTQEKLTTLLLIGIFAFMVGGCAFFTILITKIDPIKSLGYYEADAKVLNIDKQEKVNRATQYHLQLRLMTGDIQDKKTKPLYIITKHRDGLKNGDKVKLKTPEMKFKGGEDKHVKAEQLINDMQDVSNDVDPKDKGVPKFIGIDDFDIQKQK